MIAEDSFIAQDVSSFQRLQKSLLSDQPQQLALQYPSKISPEIPGEVSSKVQTLNPPNAEQDTRYINNSQFLIYNITIVQTGKIAQMLLDDIVPMGKFFDAVFTAIFGDRIAAAARAKGRRESLVTPDKLANARKSTGDFDSKRLASLLTGNNSFALLDLSVPEGLLPAGLRETLEEFKPLLQSHPHKILLLAYPGSLPDHFNEDLAAAFDRRVFVMRGGPEVYAGFYAGRFSKLGPNEPVAKDVLRRSKELLERASAQEISHGPVTVEILKKYSLVAGPEPSFNRLFGIAKQFVDQPLKIPAQREFEIKLLFLLPASSLSNAELLKQQPEEFEFRNISEGSLQMLFKQEILARIQALAEAARHILSAA